MGVNLTPVILKKIIDLIDLQGKLVAVDGNGELEMVIRRMETRPG